MSFPQHDYLICHNCGESIFMWPVSGWCVMLSSPLLVIISFKVLCINSLLIKNVFTVFKVTVCVWLLLRLEIKKIKAYFIYASFVNVLEVNQREERIVEDLTQLWGAACENKWFHVTVEAFWWDLGLGI